MATPMLDEFKQEAATTRRVLERVPTEKLTWKPHPTSMSLGQLSMHIATVPGAIAGLAQLDGFDVSQANFAPPQPEGIDQVLAAFETSFKTAEEYLSGADEDSLSKTWTMTAGDKEIMSVPRAGLVRQIMLNHWYHHRGQLSVYLRILEVPIPVIYGPSGDENPFA